MRRPFIPGNLHAFDASTVSNHLKLSRIFDRHCKTIYMYLLSFGAHFARTHLVCYFTSRCKYPILCMFVVWRLFAGSPQQTNKQSRSKLDEKKKMSRIARYWCVSRANLTFHHWTWTLSRQFWREFFLCQLKSIKHCPFLVVFFYLFLLLSESKIQFQISAYSIYLIHIVSLLLIT